jgi:hypothetical protein
MVIVIKKVLRTNITAAGYIPKGNNYEKNTTPNSEHDPEYKLYQ